MRILAKCNRLVVFLLLLVAGILLDTGGIDAQEVGNGNELSMLLTENVEKEVEVNARKRVQWMDAANGDAKITLQYASNSGELSVTQDMNVILIHDKSGSMDVNFGYHLEKVQKGWNQEEKKLYYPLLNDMQWSETILEEGSTIDLESEGAEKYLERLNRPNEYTTKVGASEGYVQKDDGTAFTAYYFRFNATCQLDGHYYLLMRDDPLSGISAWRMVQGKFLYNVENTDLHHYILITEENGQSARDRAVALISQGRRVVRMTPDSGYYYSENGETKITENLYFLDVSFLEKYPEGWTLNSCGMEECNENGRLRKTQQFMTALSANILSLNPANKIAYIPFWGSVPEDGNWKNYKGNAAGDGIVDISGYESLITSCEGVDALEFSSDPVVLQNQINHSFTYNGTNWSKAFEKAIEYLEKRSEEDCKKETLVLFLTDGMPQGTEGSSLDYGNPLISGIRTDESGKLVGGAAYELRNMQGVTVWSVGIGINELDTTGLKTRLKLIHEDGQPFYARYTADFESLKEDVFEKIENTYVENFYATDAFFKDTLSEFFVPDMAKMDSSWKIIHVKPDPELLHGVPRNIYELFHKDGADTGVGKIYNEYTGTIYWYLGILQDGTYEEPGHSLEIPVKFLTYEEDTGEMNRIIAGNLEQSLTYHTTLKPDKLYTVNIDTPKLIFFRKNAEVTVEKIVTNAKTKDRIYDYVYSREKYTSGKVKNTSGSFQITVPAGSLSGSTVLSNLESGTYYIYETDKNGNIINPQVCETVVNYNPTISTKAKSNQFPWSVTSSDNANLKNIDNYLALGFEDHIRFDGGAVLTVSKQIDADKGDIHWEHGNPTFMIRLRGTGSDGKEYVFYHTFEFTKNYVEQNTIDGKVTMTYGFYDIPVSDKYVLEEVKVSRYKLQNILSDDSAVSVIQNEESSDGFYGLKAQVNLKQNPTGISVILYNKKVNEAWFGHVTSVINQINSLEK